MKEIGGYFNFSFGQFNNCPNADGIFLNMGRNAFEYILRSLMPVNHIWVPYYTCHTVLEPIQKLGLNYSFYHVTKNLEIADLSIFEKADSYILATNYYGVKDAYITWLQSTFSKNIIVDNSQALFFPHFKRSYFSPWKFAGLPDGGIAFCDRTVSDEFEQDISYDKCIHLLKRCDIPASEGYIDYQNNLEKLHHNPIRQMSKLTRSFIDSIDFEYIKTKRLDNFRYLHQSLSEMNGISLDADNLSCPMVYPFRTTDPLLRKRLIDNKVYVAKYWPNVLEWCSPDMEEYLLTENLIPLPIDQRYDHKDMDRIIKLIRNN